MWQFTSISGHPAECFVPSSFRSEDGAILFLHGYAGESLQHHPAFSDVFEKWGLPVVCPMIPQCWWLDRVSTRFDRTVTPQQYLRLQVCEWVEKEWGVAFPRIGLLGISVGGQGVLQLAYRDALRFPVVAAISPAIDFDRIYDRGFGIEDLFPDSETARQETAILNLHPLNWPKSQFFCSDPFDANWHDGAERLASKLASSGIPHRCDLRTSHGGHGWPYFESMAEPAVDFIAQGLKRLVVDLPR
ncbi:MAG TPA: hypothetical protein VNQ76_15530 [Planctomicrobium sp.]|nr:hypothetical protein [Planctomicrobium sp.]